MRRELRIFDSLDDVEGSEARYWASATIQERLAAVEALRRLHDPTPRRLRDFLRSLRSNRVRFVVVGAHAVAAHGRPRFTGDLDVFVEPTPQNAKRVVQALRDVGFGEVDLNVEDFSTPGRVAQLGVPPVRIEILTRISGVDFERAWHGRVLAQVAGVRVPFIGLRELLENKRAAGRPKDLADIALLEELELDAADERSKSKKKKKKKKRRSPRT